MAWPLLGLGLVLVIEGLAWALAPRWIEDLLAALKSLSIEERRLAGLTAMASGAAILWAARILAGPL